MRKASLLKVQKAAEAAINKAAKAAKKSTTQTKAKEKARAQANYVAALEAFVQSGGQGELPPNPAAKRRLNNVGAAIVVVDK